MRVYIIILEAIGYYTMKDEYFKKIKNIFSSFFLNVRLTRDGFSKLRRLEGKIFEGLVFVFNGAI